MDNLEKQLLKLWEKVSALCEEPESLRERKDAAMDVDLTQGNDPQTGKITKENPKLLKINI
jgi:hypothetical protein